MDFQPGRAENLNERRREDMKLDLRVYAVTDRTWTGEKTLACQLEEALQAGVTLVQLREKEMDDKAFLEEARQIKALTDSYGVPLIINDNVKVALDCDAAGVHIGQDDMDAADVRRLLGPEKILGVTAKTVEKARRAEKAGADYLGSGAVFGSSTKREALPMTMERLKEITASVSIPVVAIGGIHRGNIRQLKGTGIAGAAVVSGIFGAEDIKKATAELRIAVEEILAEDKNTGKTAE